MNGVPGLIWTPVQRLRVFVSSTIRELAESGARWCRRGSAAANRWSSQSEVCDWSVAGSAAALTGYAFDRDGEAGFRSPRPLVMRSQHDYTERE
jgi:hypothetical protein